MRPHIFLKVSLVVKPTSFFEIGHAIKVAESEVAVSRTVFKEASTDVDFTDPCVLNDSICDSGLHSLVHVHLGHECERVVILGICLLQQQSNLLVVVYVV